LTEQPYRLVIIVGSVREGRIGRVVADWFTAIARADPRCRVELFDLAGLDLPATLDGSGDTTSFTSAIGAADAVVVVTPEYNHGYPGPLKTAIDTADAGWFAKPVGFVSYGGVSGGLRGVEQLRGVFSEVHAVGLRDTVCFPDVWDQFDEDGNPRAPERPRRAARLLLDRLAWWAHALRAARLAKPYATAR
jgi:NAD(P)H-dependent FMN reductase